MRILRLMAEGHYAVEFHPYVTVVTELADEQRRQVVEAFRAAVVGRPTELQGLMEVHEVVLDMDERSFKLLDLEQSSIDLLVDAGSLPGTASAAMERQLAAAERRLAELEAPHRELLAAVHRAETEADAARDEVVAARERLDAVRSGAEGPAGNLDEMEAALARAEADVALLDGPESDASAAVDRAEHELAEVREQLEALTSPDADRQALQARREELVAVLDPDAASALEEALAALDDAESTEHDHGAAPDGDDDGDGDEDEDEDEEEEGEEEADDEADPDRVDDRVDARIDELEGMLELLGSFDPDPVRAALDSARLDPTAGDPVPSPEALHLADRLEAVDRRIADLERRVEEQPDPEETEEATVRLAEVRSQVREMEQSVAVPETVDADIAELERVHAELIAAGEALERRLGKARAQERIDAARAAENELLERLGLRSYTDLMAGGRAELHTSSEPDELRELRAEERELEWTLQQLQRQARLGEDLHALRHDRDRLRAMARDLVAGPVPDEELAVALADLRVPATDDAPVTALVDALEGVDLPVRALDMSADELETMAAEWLDEYYRAEERRASLEQELARLRKVRAGDEPAEVAVIELTEPAPEPEPELEPDPEPEPAVSERPEGSHEPADQPEGRTDDGAEDRADEAALEAARTAVRAAKDRVIAHERTAVAVAEVDEQLAALERDDAERELARQRVAEAEEALEAALQARRELHTRRTMAEAEALQLRSEMDRHRRSASAEVEEIEVATVDTEAALADAEEQLRRAQSAFDEARVDYDAAVEEVAALRHAIGDLVDEAVPVDEIEWYLLARLAAQRQVSFAGSVPLVIDRALDGVEDEGLVHLLDRLERMAGAVQVVHLTDDERIVAWASSVGEDRVAVVSPVSARDAAEPQT